MKHDKNNKNKNKIKSEGNHTTSQLSFATNML